MQSRHSTLETFRIVSKTIEMQNKAKNVKQFELINKISLMAVPFVVDAHNLPDSFQSTTLFHDKQRAMELLSLPFPAMYVDILNWVDQASYSIKTAFLVLNGDIINRSIQNIDVLKNGVAFAFVVAFSKKVENDEWEWIMSNDLYPVTYDGKIVTVGQSRPEFLDRTIIDAGATICNILQVINCENTIVEKERDLTKINRKRASKGKKPIPEVRVIRIKKQTTKYTYSSEYEITESAEKRRSPITHFRRGHFRHYKSGRVIWIHPIMVGDPAGIEYIL
jgi:hypothetical protein